MRNALIETLSELADADERVFLLTGDLGWSVVERFAHRHTTRFLNVGVAEQNMIGIATGLAQMGYVPFVYSIATFATMRAYEQIRNGPWLHELPVRIAGIGGGFAYGPAGPTHHALEDFAVMRPLPNMIVIAPADPDQTRAVVLATMQMPGPVYLRIGKGNDPRVPGLNGRFELGRPETLRGGSDVLLLATGGISTQVVGAADVLERCGVRTAVAVLAHIGHTASDALRDLLAGFSEVVTIEEAYPVGGLGSLVAETIACQRLPCRLVRLGARGPSRGHVGSQQFLREQSGLTADAIATSVIDTRL